MIKLIDLETEYNVKIEKKSNKYLIDRKLFLTLKEVKEYLNIKVSNDNVSDTIKFKDYLRFKTILINDKPIDHDCSFLNDLYSYITWSKIKQHHSVLSVKVDEKIELVIANQYDNRNHTRMKTYNHKTRLGDKGSALESVTRIEQKVINLDSILSIYVYGVSNTQKYDITLLYRKDIKQEITLAPIHHKDTITASNNHIAFNSNKSTIHSDHGVDYQLTLKDNKVYLSVNNVEYKTPIGQYSFIVIPSIEYHYKNNGGAVNDKEKKMTLGKIKQYLNSKQYSSLYKYLTTSQYIDSYKKIMVEDEIVELKVKYTNNSISTFNLVKLDKTHFNVNLSPNYVKTVKTFIDECAIDADSIKTSLKMLKLKIMEENNQIETMLDVLNNNLIASQSTTHYKNIEYRLLKVNRKIMRLTTNSHLISKYGSADKGFIKVLRYLINEIDRFFTNKYFLTKNIDLYIYKLQSYYVLSVFVKYFIGYLDYFAYLLPCLNYLKSKLEIDLSNMIPKKLLHKIKKNEGIINNNTLEIDSLNVRINKLEKIIDNLENTNYKLAIKKLTDSSMNSDNNKRLNHLLGNEHKDTVKVYSVNSKIQVTTQNNEKSTVTLKQIEKFTRKFINLLDQDSFMMNNQKYGFNYFTTNINRSDIDKPFIEKINLPKNRLNKKILDNFDTFILHLCLNNLDRLTSLPYIYPKAENVTAWLKLNNHYLSKYGIEIIEK